MLKTFCACCICLCLLGCEKDSRAKRASSLAAVQADVARTEFNAAKTLEEKTAIAERYFRVAPELLKSIDDYMQGRKPAALPTVPAPVK